LAAFAPAPARQRQLGGRDRQGSALQHDHAIFNGYAVRPIAQLGRSNRTAARDIKLNSMRRARDDGTLEFAAAQGCPLVRARIVHGEYLFADPEDGEVEVIMADPDAALQRNLIQR
jgi:hypothetical protein